MAESTANHRFGNNEFDSDMNIVESLVRAHNNPDDKLAQAAVFNYYISRILADWNFTKIHIYSPKVAEEYKTLYRGDNPPTSSPAPEEMENYQNELLSMIDEMSRRFAKTGTYDIERICRIFEFIANVSCWENPGRNLIKDDMYGPNIYPLPNAIGIFGLNTYLYAYFNGIYLVGVPNQISNYDFERGCPTRFIYHDLEHTEDIINDTEELGMGFNKYLYYTILNDSKLGVKKRELYITILWNVIHEFPGFDDIRQGLSLRVIDDKTGEMLDNMVQAFPVTLFWGTFEKSKDIIFSQDNVDSFVAYTEKYPQYEAKRFEIVDFAEHPVVNTVSMGEPYEDLVGMQNYLYMALWRAQRYVSQLYIGWSNSN